MICIAEVAVCQKTAQSRVKKAPMIPLPVIEEPFSRIGMDIVGPLPKSSLGNRYILVLCADELIKIFARVGIPRKILTIDSIIHGLETLYINTYVTSLPASTP